MVFLMYSSLNLCVNCFIFSYLLFVLSILLSFNITVKNLTLVVIIVTLRG